jgi:polysaccharide export outer membrane protein
VLATEAGMPRDPSALSQGSATNTTPAPVLPEASSASRVEQPPVVDPVVNNGTIQQNVTGSQSVSVNPSGADAYRLGAGDRIRVTVFGEEDLSGEFQIDSSGTFSLPLIGSVDAMNLTTRELELQISGKLQEGFLKNPRTSIEVLNYRPFYILGEVNAPGSYPYQAGLTVLNAAALAGGFTYRADEDDMTISRNGDPSRTVKAQGNTVVLPGDVVRIDERFF